MYLRNTNNYDENTFQLTPYYRISELKVQNKSCRLEKIARAFALASDLISPGKVLQAFASLYPQKYTVID